MPASSLNYRRPKSFPFAVHRTASSNYGIGGSLAISFRCGLRGRRGADRSRIDAGKIRAVSRKQAFNRPPSGRRSILLRFNGAPLREWTTRRQRAPRDPAAIKRRVIAFFTSARGSRSPPPRRFSDFTTDAESNLENARACVYACAWMRNSSVGNLHFRGLLAHFVS